MALDISKLVAVKDQGGGKIVAQCPSCQSQGSDLHGKNHLVVYPDGRFGCAVDDSPEHRKHIWALVGIGGSGEDPDAMYQTSEEPRIELPKIYPPSVLDRLVKDYSYWESRGIHEETIAPFGGGIATQFQMIDRWVLPQYDDEGNIIGFSGRCLRKMSDEDRKKFHRPKWKHLSPSSMFVWGGIDEVEETREAYLVESIGDSAKMRQSGISQNLCLFGTALSDRLLGRLISLNPRKIRICTNRDKGKMMNGVLKYPGQEAAVRIHRKLSAFFDEDVLSINHPPELSDAKDFGLMTEVQIQNWQKSLDTPTKTDSLSGAQDSLGNPQESP